MSKAKTIWSLIIVVFILVVVGVFYLFNKTSYSLFSDDVLGKKTIELAVSSESDCQSNINKPSLTGGMIPVYFDENEKVWKKADKDNVNYSWYNYCEQKWANVVTVKDKRDVYQNSNIGTTINYEDINTMFVWIPRFKYELFNYNFDGKTSIKPQKILLGFEKGTETTGSISCEYNNLDEACMSDQNECVDNSCNKKIYTHPSFEDKYTGFWVSKFEVTGDLNNISVLPSKPSIRNASIRDFNDAISDMNKKNNQYGFDENINIYMMNNLQWGAVSYLANSKFGNSSDIGINNCSRYITGVGSTSGSKLDDFVCNNNDNLYYGKEGVKASTTGNVYGIYDMSGGAYEYVLGASSKDGEIVPGLSGYTSSEKIDNINLYKNTDLSTDLSISKLGDGIREVKNGSFSWNEDYNNVANSKWPWFIRGGSAKDSSIAGIFASGYSSGTSGDDFSTRIVILK